MAKKRTGTARARVVQLDIRRGKLKTLPLPRKGPPLPPAPGWTKLPKKGKLPEPLLRKQWELFNGRAINPLTPSSLVWEFKKAFYSGAALMLGIVTEIEKQSTSGSMRAALMLTLFDELALFDLEILTRMGRK